MKRITFSLLLWVIMLMHAKSQELDVVKTSLVGFGFDFNISYLAPLYGLNNGLSSAAPLLGIDVIFPISKKHGLCFSLGFKGGKINGAELSTTKVLSHYYPTWDSYWAWIPNASTEGIFTTYLLGDLRFILCLPLSRNLYLRPYVGLGFSVLDTDVIRELVPKSTWGCSGGDFQVGIRLNYHALGFFVGYHYSNFSQTQVFPKNFGNSYILTGLSLNLNTLLKAI
ncbi:MAG: hypothetical protein FWD60_05940 [Candidatus Azobacteroides sp.]|nr:hypothetical protein [Candidatus Azobacteroides sp.]